MAGAPRSPHVSGGPDIQRTAPPPPYPSVPCSLQQAPGPVHLHCPPGPPKATSQMMDGGFECLRAHRAPDGGSNCLGAVVCHSQQQRHINNLDLEALILALSHCKQMLQHTRITICSMEWCLSNQGMTHSSLLWQTFSLLQLINQLDLQFRSNTF